MAQGRNLDEAAAAARKLAEVQPSAAAMMHGQLARIEILRGNAAAALVEARQSPTTYGTRDANVALALQMTATAPPPMRHCRP